MKLENKERIQRIYNNKRCGIRIITMMIIISLFFTVDSDAGTGNTFVMDDVVVTATRTEKESLYIPNTIYTLESAVLLNEEMVRTVPEALTNVPGIMVQKTSHGQGSPYIRGFTGFRTLFLIDGIRLNNATFRDGPNQYWNTVDPLTIRTIEIMKGPASSLYGSDAIGGTVNVMTNRPVYGNDIYGTNGRLYNRYASAENSYIGRADIGGAYDGKVGWYAGFSYKDFGDLKGGEDVGEQPRTGYDEMDGDIKVEYYLHPDSLLIFYHQQVEQEDAWRTHKTIYGIDWEGATHGNEKKRTLDQDRRLTYLQYHGSDLGLFMDNIKLSLSYQAQEEKQLRIRNDDRKDIQGFSAGTTGFWAQFDAYDNASGIWTYGIEYYHDDVDSFRYDYNADGSFKKTAVQGPVGDDGAYDLFDVFLQYDLTLKKQFNLIAGTRYTYAGVDIDKVEDPETGDVMSISNLWDKIVGSLRGIYHLDQDNRFNLFAGISTGFRAPNLSDLSRLDTARSNEIETAAPDLEPESVISYEFGAKTAVNGFFSQASVFYMDVDNAIIRTPTGRIIDGDNEVTKKNVGDGSIYGIELDMNWQATETVFLTGGFSWMDGEIETYPTSDPVKVKEPPDRLMPVTWCVGVKWTPVETIWLAGRVTHADEQNDLSTRDQSDTQRIPPGGTPGYTIFSINGGWKIVDDLILSLALENITDEDYRIHGSGQNEPGRNIIVGLDYRF